MKIKRFIGGNLESNCYIVSLNKDGCCFAVDPGYNPQKLIKYIEDEQMSLKGIILTHHHHDHVGAADKLSNHFGSPVMMSFEDSIMYKGEVDKYLNDGDIIEFAGENFVIRLTPGHTHGSICIVSDKNNAVFTGDTLFDTDLGRTDLEDGDKKEMISTCKNIIDKWPDRYTIYPGHDQSATMKTVRRYNSEFLQCLEA